MKQAASEYSGDQRVQEAMSPSEVTIRIARHVASVGFSRADLAGLRRMDPEYPNAAAFWRLTAEYDVLRGEDSECRWGLICYGIALMTKTARGDPLDRSAHVPGMPVGCALFTGGDPNGGTAFYRDLRLNQLLTAHGSAQRTQIARMLRVMSTVEQRFDWRQMSQFILSDGDIGERVRRTIARDYYRAEFRRKSFRTSA